jgi:hypothetical protein
MALQRLTFAEAALTTAGRQQARWTDVRAFCDAVVDRLAELEQPEHFARKQELVRTLVTTVWVYPDHLSIEGVLPVVSSDVIVTPTPWVLTNNYTEQTPGHAFRLEVVLP